MNDVEENVPGTKETPGLVPGPGTFSFEDFVVGKSTFPKFRHKVYLDQAAGVKLQDLIDEAENIQLKIKRYESSRDLENRSGLSMVDDSGMDISDLNDRLKAIEVEMVEVEKTIADTGLTLIFQVSTIDKLTSVVRDAEKAFTKKHGRGNEDDINHMSMRSRFVLLAQLAAYCVGVEDAHGNTAPTPDEKGFTLLLDRMISSESVRLLQAINKGLDSATTWAERVDAGFPGGGVVVA